MTESLEPGSGVGWDFSSRDFLSSGMQTRRRPCIAHGIRYALKSRSLGQCPKSLCTSAAVHVSSIPLLLQPHSVTAEGSQWDVISLPIKELKYKENLTHQTFALSFYFQIRMVKKPLPWKLPSLLPKKGAIPYLLTGHGSNS